MKDLNDYVTIKDGTILCQNLHVPNFDLKNLIEVTKISYFDDKFELISLNYSRKMY